MRPDIVFDFDGTLVSVVDRFYAVYKDICEELGLRIISKRAYWDARQRCLGTLKILKMTSGEELYETFISKRSRLIESRDYLRMDHLRADAHAVLAELSKEHHISIVSMRESTEGLAWQIEYLGISAFIHSVHTGSPWGGHREKANILRQINLSTCDSVCIIGDTEVDILAGKAIGATTCGILDGMRTQPAVENLMPDHVIHSLGELVGIIKEMGSL